MNHHPKPFLLLLNGSVAVLNAELRKDQSAKKERKKQTLQKLGDFYTGANSFVSSVTFVL
jgi:hypothetical protein